MRGKKRGITRNDLLTYFAAERLLLNERTITAELAKFWNALPRWRELIDASFLSAPRKKAYRELLDRRLHLLSLEA